MITKIKAHPVLTEFIDDTCCENGVCVTFDPGFDPNNFVIIKVDKYYNSLKIEKRPPSIDCLIVRKCINSDYGLSLVELKNIESSKGFEAKNVIKKFETSLFDFVKGQFSEVLDLNYKCVKLFFVTKQEIYKRDLGLKMEVLINSRFKFNEKTLMISPKMPTPTIKNCY